MSQVRNHFVRQMAKKILSESNIEAPPVNLLLILAAHGIGYEEIDDFPDTVDALFINDGAKVYAAVNARQHLHRQRFSLAHELGHFFLHPYGMPEDAVSIDNPPTGEEEMATATKSPTEMEADLFAGELLVPLELLKAHLREGIPELSKLFQVSEQVVSIAIAHHMKALYK